jgi:hypothetical protein
MVPTFIPGARIPGEVPAVVFRLKEWPAERLRRLAELWPDPTWTIQAMARELGVDDDAVLRRAKELGLQGRPRSIGDPWPNEWRPIPPRQWCSYGDDPLPTPEEALGEPLSAFPSWFLRMECATCGRQRYANEVHLPHWRDATLREIVARIHHEGCGGRPKLVELITGIAERPSLLEARRRSEPVRKIVLLD